MHSLSLKVVPGTNLLAGGDRRWAQRTAAVAVKASSSSSTSDGGGNANGGGGKKSGGDSTSSSASSFLSRSQTYALLKQQLVVAAKHEDYKEAARIRDSLRSFEEEEPVLRIRRLMKDAIDEERFERGLCFVSDSYP